jgi:hypothetical protein
VRGHDDEQLELRRLRECVPIRSSL